jgi:hypothetical protein
MFNNFFSENRALYEMMSKNTVEPQRPQMAMCSLLVTCWISKGTHKQAHSGAVHPHSPTLAHACADTHTQKYVILFVFLWKVLLWRASVLRYTYAVCNVGSQSSVRIAWHLGIQLWPSSGTWQKNTDNLQDPVVSSMRIYRHLSSSPRYQNSRESGKFCQTITSLKTASGLHCCHRKVKS